MGSTKPSTLPFGYDFAANNEYPSCPPPPAPASGPSLIDEVDHKYLESFFQSVSADQFNGHEFFDKAIGVSGAYELPFGWNELGPAFIGPSSAFAITQQGQHSSHPSIDVASGLMANDMASVSSAEVLAAAGTLMAGHSHNGADNVGLGSDYFTADDISRTLQTGPSLANQSRASTHSTSMTPFSASMGISTSASPSGKESYLHNAFYTEMNYGSTNLPARTSKPEDIQWGSDSGFGASNFIAPPGHESSKGLARDMLKHLDCFQPKVEVPFQPCTSASTAQSSSPVTLRAPDSATKNRRQSIHPMGFTNREDEGGSTKRRTSTAVDSLKIENSGENDDSQENAPNANVPPRKRKQPTPKSNSSSNDASQPTPATAKRRKSSNNGNYSEAKNRTTRENLTEDQKRENHIKSEQKRRTLIKEGFEDLGELVPELAGGGFSKSAVLLMAGEWLEDLVKGNEHLRRQLATLEERNGMS